MSTIAALRALFFAGECFFGGSLILFLAWLATRTQQAAARRHLVWTGAFTALIALPLAALIVPASFALALLPSEAPPPAMVPVQAVMAAAPAPHAPMIGTTEVISALAAVWLAGVIVIALRLIAGWIGLLLLQRHSVPHIPEGIDASRLLGAPRWELRLRTAPGDAGALTWGVFKAIVLLPKSSVRWPRERLESVLLHEIAHVRRRDCLARLVAMAACAVYWPNPFVWSAARAMRCDAEIAADDAVLTCGVRASAYAEHLLQLAARGEPHLAGVTLSMAEPSTLRERVQSVLSATQSRTGVSKMDVFKMAMLGVAVTALFAAARPSLAQAPEDANARVVANPTDPVPASTKVVAIDSDDATDADAPVSPEAPPAPPSDVAPPAPPAAAAPPAPPAPPHESAEFRHEMHRHAAEMHRAQIEMQRVQREVQKAIAAADIDRTVAQALKDAEPELARARAVDAAKIREAIAKAHISEKVAAAMREASENMRRAADEMEQHSRAAHERGEWREQKAHERHDQIDADDE